MTQALFLIIHITDKDHNVYIHETENLGFHRSFAINYSKGFLLNLVDYSETPKNYAFVYTILMPCVRCLQLMMIISLCGTHISTALKVVTFRTACSP